MNLLERISHVRELGGMDGMYELYFKDDRSFLEEKVYLNEKEFYMLDELYDGELAIRVI